MGPAGRISRSSRDAVVAAVAGTHAVHRRMREGGVLVLDVRPAAEYAAGHVAGAVSGVYSAIGSAG